MGWIKDCYWLCSHSLLGSIVFCILELLLQIMSKYKSKIKISKIHKIRPWLVWLVIWPFGHLSLKAKCCLFDPGQGTSLGWGFSPQLGCIWETTDHLFLFFLIWNASRTSVSSLRRRHANLLCIVPILVFVLPKRAPIICFLFILMFLSFSLLSLLSKNK